MSSKEGKGQKSRQHKTSSGSARGAKRMRPALTEVEKVNLGQGMARRFRLVEGRR